MKLAYNQTLQKNDYEPIDFDKYEAEMDKFKMKYIYDKIYAEENKENVFYGFFGFIDTFRLAKNDEDARPDGTHIFDFLGQAAKTEAVVEEEGEPAAKSTDNVD